MKQVRPKKNLGQHFLTDLTIARAIADTVDAYPDIPVLEVGPGMGVLTQFLVEKPRPLTVVEIDRESVEYLKERYPFFSRKEASPRSEEDSPRSVEDSPRDEEDSPRSVECGVRSENSTEIQSSVLVDSYTQSISHSTLHTPHSTLLTPHSTLLTPHSSLHTPHSSENPPRVLLSADFLRMDLREVFDGQPFVLTGNYPYDISSQIFFKMLDNKELIPCCTGMIQREVALRIASQPCTKAYGILSVLIQAWYDVEYLFTVDEHVFNPPPKVKSAVIRMTRNDVRELGCDERLFKRVVKTVFNQRRKMLRVSLRQLFSKDHMPDAAFFAQEIMTKRPEQLSIPQFVELTNLCAAFLI